MMEKILRWIDTCSVFGGYLSAFFMVLIVILISVEIFLRTFFNFSTLIADEYSAYFFVVVVMMGLALTLKDGAHIRITLVTSRLGKTGEKICDLFAMSVAIILCAYALYHSTFMIWDTYQLEMTADTISETPIYIPQIVIPVGFFLLEIQLLAGFIRRLLSYPIR